MKRVLFAIVGAIAFAVASYGLVELFASWYAPRYIKSDSDIGDAFMWSLGFMLLSCVVGAICGFKMAGRGRSAGAM